jgi:hypothetical protein
MLRKIAINAVIFTALSGHVLASNANSNHDGPEDEGRRMAAPAPSGAPEEAHVAVMRTIGQSITPIMAQIQKCTDPEERKALEKQLAQAVKAQEANLQLLGSMFSKPAAVIPTKTTLDAYLASTPKARLMIGCGHDHEIAKKRTAPIPAGISAIEVKLNDQKYRATSRNRHKMDLSMAYNYHAHKGWFTIDSDDISTPDCSASLVDAEALNRLLPADTFQLVMEELSEGALYTRVLFAAIARSLSKGGVLVANLPFVAASTDGKSENCIHLDPDWAGDLWHTAFPVALRINIAKERNSLTAQLKRAKDQLKEVKGQKRLVASKKQHLNSLISELEADLVKLKSDAKSQMLKGRFEGPSHIEERLLPVFQSLGFTKIEVLKSDTFIFLQLKGMGAFDRAPDNYGVQIGNRMTTIGELKAKGPHPEASAIDPYFKDKPLSMYYLIARK